MHTKAVILTTVCCLSVGLTGPAMADITTSTNFKISWDVTDGGGGTMMSSNYTLNDSLGQSTPVGENLSANYTLVAGFQAPPDTDVDQVRNLMDNCTLLANTDQRDTNGDGYGNICDPDLNNDGIVNPADLGLVRANFFAVGDLDADFNGDGVVNPVDLGVLRSFFFAPPGPSGVAP